jgi:hypothetical protein
MTDYPTEGARISATTGKSIRDHILDDANLGEDRVAVSLLASYIANTSPGWRSVDRAIDSISDDEYAALKERLGWRIADALSRLVRA